MRKIDEVCTDLEFILMTKRVANKIQFPLNCPILNKITGNTYVVTQLLYQLALTVAYFLRSVFVLRYVVYFQLKERKNEDVYSQSAKTRRYNKFYTKTYKA